MRRFRADPREGAEFLERNPGVAFVETMFTSMNGVPRGKRLRRSEIAKLYQDGALNPASILGVDILGADVPSNGLLWETGDADAIMLPVPGGIVPAPWLGDDVAQVMCSLHNLDGTLNPLDPRAVLDGVVKRLAKDNLRAVVACELEFYLIENGVSGSSAISLRRSPLTGRVPFGAQAHGLVETEDAADFLRALWKCADAQNIPLGGMSAEASPGQLELTLGHQPDALQAGDDAISFKRAAKGVARTLQSEATFMAKPFAEIAGSGMHIHMSMLGRDGRNIFAADEPRGTPQLGHALGGMLATMADGMALLAPNANSYRRFMSRSHAPVAANWGVNNRTVALRVPAGSADSRRVEHRVSGADANPYLALAVVLAGAHHGLVNKIDPGPPVVGDGYNAPHLQAGLPLSWEAALSNLHKSSIMRTYLGDAFVDLFVAVKRDELARFQAVVTSLDYDWYLQNA